MEVKSEVFTTIDRVDIKVDEIKTDVAEIKIEIKLFGER